MKEDTPAAKGPPSSEGGSAPLPQRAAAAPVPGHEGTPSAQEAQAPRTEESPPAAAPAAEIPMPGVEKIAGGGELLDLFEDAEVSFGPELPAAAQLPPPAQAVPPAPVPAPAPLAKTSAAPTPTSPSSPSPLSRAPLCGAMSAAEGSLSFENFLVGPYNRFAHAAATAAASSPGDMYNPLFINGGPGTGKTHLLHALAKELASKFEGGQGAGEVWLSSGSRLSSAATLALGAGRAEELSAFAAKAKALLIDDLHLMEVTEANRALLTNILHAFLDNGKQVVLTSAYPPKVLGALEAMLNFRIGSGWSGDLKTPKADDQREIVSRLLKSAGLEAVDELRKPLEERLAGGLGEVDVHVGRMSRLRDIRMRSGRRADPSELAALLLGAEGEAQPAVPAEKLSPSLSSPGPAPMSGERVLAVFHPAGAQVHAQWVLRRLQETAAENGWKPPFRQPDSKEWVAFDSNQLNGVPFALAGECRGRGADAVLMLGPLPGSELAGCEEELRYALRHLIESSSAVLAWVPFIRIQEPQTLLRAMADIAAGSSGGGA